MEEKSSEVTAGEQPPTRRRDGEHIVPGFEPLTSHRWTFPATAMYFGYVVDGDTVDVLADQRFHTLALPRIRLANVDTAEIYGRTSDEEYERGKEHQNFVRSWIEANRQEHDGLWSLILTIDGQGKYGRWVGDMYGKGAGEHLTDALVEEYPEVEE